MKKYLFISLIALCSIIMSCFSASQYSIIASADTTTASNYEAGLCDAVANLREAQTPEEIEAAATVLETVASQDAKNWLANYHLAYAYGRLAHTCPKTKDVDGWVEKSDSALKKSAKCDNADASEIHVLDAYLDYARIRVNPMVRGYKLSKTAMGKLSSAVKANGNNPRAYLLITQHLINVPAMLGGDPEKACEYNNAAQKTYAMEAAEEGRDPLSPSWGKSDSDAIATDNCADESTSKRD